MSKKTTSRHGLSRCPACNAFTKNSAEDAACVFCGAALNAGGSRVRDLVNRGRSGLIAASLFGLGGLAACDSPGDNPPSGDAVITLDNGTSSDAVLDAGTDAGTETDVVILPPYGIPPDPDVSPSDASADTSQDIGPQPAYGIPPDGF